MQHVHVQVLVNHLISFFRLDVRLDVDNIIISLRMPVAGLPIIEMIGL